MIFLIPAGDPISIRICPGTSEIEFRELLKEFAPQKWFKIEIGGPEAEIGKINGSQAEKLNTNSDAIKNVLKIDFSNFLQNLTWTLRNFRELLTEFALQN